MNPDINRLDLEAKAALGKAQRVTQKATDEGRGMTEDEKTLVDGYIAAADRAADKKASAIAADNEASRIRGAGPSGKGWNALAKAIAGDPKQGARQAEVRLKDLTQTGDDSMFGLREPGITAGDGTTVDQRFIFGVIPSTDVGAALAITDYRMISRSIEEGSGDNPVLRDPKGDSEKAELDLHLEAFSIDMQQVAVTVRDIPNAILALEPAVQSLFGTQMALELNRAVDQQVLTAIQDATPDSSGGYDSIEAAVRAGQNAMLAKGIRPSTVVINPDDAATIDLKKVTDTINAWPFSLNVVVSPDSEAGTALLIAPEYLHRHTGRALAATDIYSGFTRNTSTLLLEGNSVVVVRNSDALYQASIGS